MKLMPTSRAAALLSLLALLAASSASALSLSDLWINEIHYDNDGSDQDEFVELAGLAGTDLSGSTLTLYNGSNGESYRTIALSGLLTNQSNGYGFHTVALAGIQNGAPDGLALSFAGSLLQFLSYEGSFEAVEGDATGSTSQDIGVEQAASTPLGLSLQLTGLGKQYEDFTWSFPSAATPGALNNGQSMPAPVSRDTSAVPDSGASYGLLTFAFAATASLRRRLQKN